MQCKIDRLQCTLKKHYTAPEWKLQLQVRLQRRTNTQEEQKQPGISSTLLLYRFLS